MSPRKVHDGQVDIDAPLVRELVAAQFPQWAALPLEPIGSSGLVNAVYRLGTDLSVRLPLRPTVTDEVLREQAKLTALAPFLPVAIPSVGPSCGSGRALDPGKDGEDRSPARAALIREAGPLNRVLSPLASLNSPTEFLSKPEQSREQWPNLQSRKLSSISAVPASDVLAGGEGPGWPRAAGHPVVLR